MAIEVLLSWDLFKKTYRLEIASELCGLMVLYYSIITPVTVYTPCVVHVQVVVKAIGFFIVVVTHTKIARSRFSR